MNQETPWKTSLFIKFKEAIEVNLDQHKREVKMNTYWQMMSQDQDFMILNK